MHVGSVFLAKPIIRILSLEMNNLTEQNMLNIVAIAWSLFTANAIAAIIFLLLIFTEKKLLPCV